MQEEKEAETAKEKSPEADSGNDNDDMGGIEKNTVTFTYDWDALINANADVIGWLYLPDTPIDLPVVGTSDNDY